MTTVTQELLDNCCVIYTIKDENIKGSNTVFLRNADDVEIKSAATADGITKVKICFKINRQNDTDKFVILTLDGEKATQSTVIQQCFE